MNINTDSRVATIRHDIEVIENRLAVYVPNTLLTPAQYRSAAEELVGIKAVKKKVEEVRKSMTRPLDESKKAIMDFFRGPTERLEAAEQQIKGSILAYDREQARLARLEREAAERAAAEERERLEVQAAQAAYEGRLDDAADLQQSAQEVVPAPVFREPPSVKDVHTMTVYRFEVVDPEKVPRDYLAVDEAKIGAVVRATKGQVKIPGVRVFEDQTVCAGGRR